MTILEQAQREAFAYRHNPLAARWSVGAPGHIRVADDSSDPAGSSRCPACANGEGTVIRVAAATLTYHCVACRAEWTVLRHRRPVVAGR
jgi:hypothetical protein